MHPLHHTPGAVSFPRFEDFPYKREIIKRQRQEFFNPIHTFFKAIHALFKAIQAFFYSAQLPGMFRQYLYGVLLSFDKCAS